MAGLPVLYPPQAGVIDSPSGTRCYCHSSGPHLPAPSVCSYCQCCHSIILFTSICQCGQICIGGSFCSHGIACCSSLLHYAWCTYTQMCQACLAVAHLAGLRVGSNSNLVISKQPPKSLSQWSQQLSCGAGCRRACMIFSIWITWLWCPFSTSGPQRTPFCLIFCDACSHFISFTFLPKTLPRMLCL